ncbi:inclusion membrane protein GarD [Chlamydia psittaci]|uniref:inclusion membrane protein GarD n=1 Tax=Chlamydia psittaci TaxID=83554 RepID=UPI0002B29F5D|nr:hypothetical protein [Chlamydia psittaci]AGE75121.1 putative inner membrane protein [Chlamydia psittaci Mat116]AZU10673.1 hypothetical protein D3X08_02760 [Chlamydia psittaci]
MSVSSLNNKVGSANTEARFAILNFTDKGGLSFTSLDSRSHVHNFLTRHVEATSASINSVALSGVPLSPGVDAEAESAFAIMTASEAVLHCIEHVLWIRFLCDLCRGNTSGGSNSDSIFSSFILGILATLVLGIFGASLGSTILSSIKINSASKEIFRLKQTNREISLDVSSFQANTPEKAKAKAAALVTLEANKELASAYKNYRAAKIGYLVCAIICSIALLALAAGAILGIFFTGPLATAAISAAIIGSCAAGGSLLFISFVSFAISSIYMAKKQKSAVLHLNKATLYTMVANQISLHPEEYQRNIFSQTVAQQCLANQQAKHMLSYSELAYVQQLGSNRGQQPASSPNHTTPSAPPYPGYADAPPSYEDAIRSGQ